MRLNFYVQQSLVALITFFLWSISDLHTSMAMLPLFSLATTAMCATYKNEGPFMAGHCLNAVTTKTASGVSGAFTLTGMADTAGIVVGMAATGTNVAAGAVVASIDSTSQVTVSKAHTGTITTQTITYTADALKGLLIKVGPTRTFDGTQTNVGTPGTGAPTAANVGTDEVAAGGGYTAGGLALVNISGIVSGATALADFNDLSWSSATFSCTALVIYNTSTRIGGSAAPLNNRSISVHDFGGTQTVSAGTLTVVFPTADASNAILRFA